MKTLTARCFSSPTRFMRWGFAACILCLIAMIGLFFSYVASNDDGKNHDAYIKKTVTHFFTQQTELVQSQKNLYQLAYAQKNDIPYVQDYLLEIATTSSQNYIPYIEFVLLDARGNVVGSVSQDRVFKEKLANNRVLSSSVIYLSDDVLKHKLNRENHPLQPIVTQLKSAEGNIEYAFANFFPLELKTKKKQTTHPFNLLILKHISYSQIAQINQLLPISNMQLVLADDLSSFDSSKFEYIPLSGFIDDNFVYFLWHKLDNSNIWGWLPIVFSTLFLLILILLILIYQYLRNNLKNVNTLVQANQALENRFDAQGQMLQELANLPTHRGKNTQAYLNHITEKLANTLNAKSVSIISPDQNSNKICCIASFPSSLVEQLNQQQNTNTTADWPLAHVSSDEALAFLQQLFYLPTNHYHSINIEHRNRLFGLLLIELNNDSKQMHADEQLFCHNVGSILALHFESEQRSAAEQKLFKQDYFDALTHLPNQKHLHLQLNGWLHSKLLGAILLFGFDNLLSINETYGREKGDQLLLYMGKRLTQTTQANEFIARLGENRFAVLVSASSIESLTYRIKQLFSVLNRPFRINSQVLPALLDGGVAFFPKDANNEHDLLSCAERAIQSARQQPGSLHFFDSVLGEKWIYRQNLINQLHQALSNKELFLYFQPYMHLPTGQIQGAEALIRWQNQLFGSISPEEFIPLAEEVDLIKEIGLWVLHQAALQTNKWRTMYKADFNIAVNVSPKQLEDASFAQSVLDILLITELPASALELEITEMIALQQNAVIDKNISTLQEHGINLAIDDFGSGYASFNYIKRFATRRIKIDRKFIGQLLKNTKDENLVKVIVAMGHALDAHVTAEGVDHIKQINLLKTMGCDFAQGFAISKPLCAKDFEKFISHLEPNQFQLDLNKP